MKSELKMDKDLPLVSVAIITYNQKEYLKECIESILAQDYENIEIVVADDGSTDGTQEMLKEYKKRYPNKFVLILSDKNQGITANSNLALSACKGKYICIVGGDDKFEKSKISEQVRFMEHHDDYVLCGTYTYIIDENSKIIGLRKEFKKKRIPSYSLCELIESGNTLIPVASYMFRKEAAPSSGFDFRLPVASDSLFYYHIASKGKIWIIPKPLTYYRVHNSHASRIGYYDDSFVSLALCEYFFPQCLDAVRKARASLMYSIGTHHLRKGNFRIAKYYLKSSLKYKFRLKTFLRYILLFLGSFLRRLKY